MTIQSHTLLQGTSNWHAFRAQHFGSSEAGAMLGMSPYKTRTQLLNEKKSGLAPDVDAFTQKIFDKGHAVEALTRPIVEKLIGEELSPMTFSNGKLSASCDGLSFMGDIAWENKQFNAAHFEQVKNGELPEIHWPQCQQVLHCTGAEKLFFTVSDGTEERTVGVWVYPDADKVTQLIVGWDQFEKDLADHVPPVRVEKVEAEEVKTLPVPSVVVRGEIAASNLNEITPLFDKYLGEIKTELSNDQDFADAEANAKNCRETAKRIQALRTNIIAQMADVNAVDSTLANYEEAFNKVGLRLEKAVKEQKEMLKTNAILKGQNEFTAFVSELEKSLPFGIQTKLNKPEFAEAIKGVKTLESMQSRINDALANSKAEATTLANDVKTKLAYITEAIKGYEHLFILHELAFKDLDYIKLNIQSVKDAEDKRKAEHEAAIKAKTEADALAKVEADRKPEAVLEPVGIPEAAATTSTAATASMRPTAEAIISLVAKTYVVDSATANRWLAQSFSELKAA